MISVNKFLTGIFFIIVLNSTANSLDPLLKLRISDNKRFLVKENEVPFIWIGDTFWDWYKLPPNALDKYLAKCVGQGYTVIQIQIGVYGHANYAGDWCFGGTTHKDITRPQESFWQYADKWMGKIREHGLYAAVGLSWILNHWNIPEAAKACDGSYAYIYSAYGSDFSVDLTKLGQKGDFILSQWFDPREGIFPLKSKKYKRVKCQSFNPPLSQAVNNDWILVLSLNK